jgi:proline dehydrogenase
MADGLAAVRALNLKGISGTLNYLGEATSTEEETASAVQQYEDVITAIHASQVRTQVSVKLTHIGLLLSEEKAGKGVEQLANLAARHENGLSIDMEESRYVEPTLRVYRDLYDKGLTNVCVAMQAYLYRSETDLAGLLPLKPSVRLVKGAYLEKPDVAYPRKPDVDANFAKLAELAISGGAFTAIATHDERLINHVLEFTNREGMPREHIEFQMMHGVRERLQQELSESGYSVRVTVSFGTDWYGFFMRRLAERPANMLFFLRNLARR